MAESKARLISKAFTSTGDIRAENLDNVPPGGLDSAAIGWEVDIFRINKQTLSINHTIDSADNAISAGPITVDSGVTLTVNGYWSVV
jgi:hypothetical protein